MLTYDIELRKDKSLYMYLYECIKDDITSGKLIAGQKLPSKRELSERLKVSVMTVQNAYAELLEQGYIKSLLRKGYFVEQVEFIKIASVPFVSSKKQEKVGFAVDFSANSISQDKFPFSVWSRQIRETLSEGKGLEAPCLEGCFALRNAIAKLLYRMRGINVEEKQIFIGAGSQHFYNTLSKFFKGSVFALEEPGYLNIGKSYELEGITCKHISLDGDGINLQELIASKANIAHISPNHHFPTGIVMSIKRRTELLNWANQQSNRYIIEDDYDSEFRHVGKIIPTLQSIDNFGKVIYMNTFTKTISPSLRISFMALPQQLVEKYQALFNFYSCSVSSFEQLALAKFIDKGYFEQHINRMRKIYKAKRDGIINIIKDIFKQKVTITEQNSGLHFIIRLSTALSDQEVISKASYCGIRLVAVSSFYHNLPKLEHEFIINYSCLELDKARATLSNLSKYV
ncbi:MAG: PLP-dependent aminotransferase family protein [Clostridia bacterium]